MALKTFNPTSPGRRQLVMVDRAGLYKGKPVKALTEGLSADQSEAEFNATLAATIDAIRAASVAG